MLVLKRKPGEVLAIGEGLRISIVGREQSAAIDGWLLRLETAATVVVVPVWFQSSVRVEVDGAAVTIVVLRPEKWSPTGAFLGITAPREVPIHRLELMQS